jgi:hypothetical protein
MSKANEDWQYQIQLDRCLVILTSKEINTLLQKDTEICARALKRGKYLIRGQKQNGREKAKFERGQCKLP